MASFTHLDSSGRPSMVDVGAKEVTHRSATARSTVTFPLEVAKALQDGGNQTKKGAVFQVAELAGIMAAKKTAELIPLCHPLATEKIRVQISWQDATSIHILCEVSLHGKTGVEMEALTGASIAALTIYDMCKALSHDIVISDTRLIQKTGGKSDIHQAL